MAAGIYLLSDPRTFEPKYVGQAKRLSVRLKAYAKAEKAHSMPLRLWLGGLSYLDLEPLVTILETCQECELDEREAYWYHVLSQDYALLNIIKLKYVETKERYTHVITTPPPLPRFVHPPMRRPLHKKPLYKGPILMQGEN